VARDRGIDQGIDWERREREREEGAPLTRPPQLWPDFLLLRHLPASPTPAKLVAKLVSTPPPWRSPLAKLVATPPPGQASSKADSKASPCKAP
jgi:hypothetical protein